MSKKEKKPTLPPCAVATKQREGKLDWELCGKPSTLDLGDTKQLAIESNGTSQMARYLCDDHKVSEKIK